MSDKDLIVKTRDGLVWWPPKVVANIEGTYSAYPGKIRGVCLGWVRIPKKLFNKALKEGAKLSDQSRPKAKG